MPIGLGLGLRTAFIGGLPLPTAIFGSALKMWIAPNLGITTTGGHITSISDQSGSGVGGWTGLNGASGPTQGSGINGKPTFAFSAASSQIFTSSILLSAVHSASAWFRGGVFRYTGSVVETGPTLYYNDAGIFGDNSGAAGGFASISVSTTKLSAGQAVPGANADQVPITTGTNYYFVQTYDGTTVRTSLNGAALDAGVAIANISDLTHALRIGVNYAQTVFFDGELGDLVAGNVNPSAGQLAALNAFLKSKYGL